MLDLIDYFDWFENSRVILSVSKSAEIIKWLKLLGEWFFRNEIDQCLKHFDTKVAQVKTTATPSVMVTLMMRQYLEMPH